MQRRTKTYNATPTVTLYGLKRSVEVTVGTLRADGPEPTAKRALRHEVNEMDDEELASVVRRAFTTDATLDVDCHKVRE